MAGNAKPLANRLRCIEFAAMPLPIIDAESVNGMTALTRNCCHHHRIQPARKQYDGRIFLPAGRSLGHGMQALSASAGTARLRPELER